MDIPTLKEIEFFEEISLVFWSNGVERQIIVQREKQLLQFPPPEPTHQFISFFNFSLGDHCPESQFFQYESQFKLKT